MAGRPISDEIKKYGYVFSTRRSIAAYAAAAVLALILSRIYGLSRGCEIMLLVFTLLLLPFFLKNAMRNRYNQQRFSDLNIYMEQFLYSFQKTGKVLETLKDVRQLFEKGQMKETLDQAVRHIETTYNEMDVERGGLRIIEKVYPYSGLKTIHSFALEVEKNGGEYQTSILLLLEARRMWAGRNDTLLKQKKHERTRIVLSILTTLLICTMVYYLSWRLHIDVASNPLAQVVTTVVLCLDLLIFYLADRKFCQDDAIRDEGDVSDILAAEKRIAEYSDKNPLDRLGKKSAVKRVARQLEKDFPKWLMQVSLLLQSENVQVAVFRSYETAPEAMKPYLRRLIVALKKDPASIRPYQDFLSEFTLPEVRSSMKMLYSLSEGTGGAAGQQIGDIIKRNQEMMDRADRLRNEDALAGMYALFLAPQLTGGFKLLVDMILLFAVYMTNLGRAAG